MKFLVGLLVGMVVGKPTMRLVNRQFSRMVQAKMAEAAYNLAQRLDTDGYETVPKEEGL